VDVREITFRSAILAKRVRISSWMPSAKIGVRFIFAPIFERQNGDRFLWRCYGHFLTGPETLIGENCNHEQQDADNQKSSFLPVRRVID